MATTAQALRHPVAPATATPIPNRSLTVQSASGRPTAANRFARDLHDGVGEALNGLLVQIRVALARGEADREDLELLEQAAQSAIQSVRRLAYRARRRSSRSPLDEAHAYGESLLMTSGVALTWIDDRSGDQVAYRLASQLGWCLRESLTNVARHANARNVEVRLSEVEGRVRITISDDGDGFAPEGLEPTADGRGLGLLGNAERMRDVGGVFAVRTAPGEGTVVTLEAPASRARLVLASAGSSRLDDRSVADSQLAFVAP